jgi:hypothetical protein
MIFFKKKPSWNFLISKEEVAKDFALLNIPPGVNLVKHLG